jgi:hypothetical protein
MRHRVVAVRVRMDFGQGTPMCMVMVLVIRMPVIVLQRFVSMEVAVPVMARTCYPPQAGSQKRSRLRVLPTGKNHTIAVRILGSGATRRAEEERARPVVRSHGWARRTRCATFRCDRSGGGYW